MSKCINDQSKQGKPISPKNKFSQTSPITESKSNREEKIEKLPIFENPKGFMSYGKIPYKIFRSLEQPAGAMVNQETPAKFKVTPDTGGGLSLSIWIWEGTPSEFRDILFYHELKEAEFLFVDGLSKDEAHKKAVSLHMTYAKKFLPEDKFREFLEWQSQFEKYGADSFFGK